MNELLSHMPREDYDKQVTDDMGVLYNKFVIFISESRVPLPHVVTVLQMLINESIQVAKERYIG